MAMSALLSRPGTQTTAGHAPFRRTGAREGWNAFVSFEDHFVSGVRLGPRPRVGARGCEERARIAAGRLLSTHLCRVRSASVVPTRVPCQLSAPYQRPDEREDECRYPEDHDESRADVGADGPGSEDPAAKALPSWTAQPPSVRTILSYLIARARSSSRALWCCCSSFRVAIASSSAECFCEPWAVRPFVVLGFEYARVRGAALSAGEAGDDGGTTGHPRKGRRRGVPADRVGGPCGDADSPPAGPGSESHPPHSPPCEGSSLPGVSSRFPVGFRGPDRGRDCLLA